LLACAGAIATVVATRQAMRPLPESLAFADVNRPSLIDREGRTISITLDNPWNVDDRVDLHAVPGLLRAAFVEAEDRRFFDHGGVDWPARAHAVVQNLRARRSVRGASTISEQVVRMLHPRRRTIQARWIEGFEARRLEQRFDKGEILEFYLNQVPYARNRRGVVQAARDLFDRDLETLSTKEMLALAVLVRRPSGLDPRREDDGARHRLEAAVSRLATRLHETGQLTTAELERVAIDPLVVADSGVDVSAPHFALQVRERLESTPTPTGRVRTTLDGALQLRLESILERQIFLLARRGVSDGALLVADHRTNEILAWVNAGGYSDDEGSRIDAVVTPRQPGSTLKPFLYALAMEDGWTAATLIDDSPFAGPVGAGLHRYRNYSRHYHGPVRLRTALGNSLNIPAVRAVQTVTPSRFHETLQALGLRSLGRHPEFYGEGLALGNGEVTLLELVEAYATLARGGVHEPLRMISDALPTAGPGRVFSPEVSSIVADILSDPEARTLEFGVGGVLDMPVQTAVKTGTSNDYRDAWTVGFSDRYTVGVWMGNLDRREMDGVSGSIGPALVLRAAFAELRKRDEPRPLTVSRAVSRTAVCRDTGARATENCPAIDEWFRPERAPRHRCAVHSPAVALSATGGADRRVQPPSLARPTPGLHLAMDPRIPDRLEAFAFELDWAHEPTRVDWFVDGKLVGSSPDRRWTWNVERGEHVVTAHAWTGSDGRSFITPPVRFLVK
jgi:penicillin-binding protein 1C